MSQDVYAMYYDVSRLGPSDVYYFKEGTHTMLYDKLGAHAMKRGDEQEGYYFGVWAPHAREVFVRGDFNDYSMHAHPLRLRNDDSGIWEGFIAGVTKGLTYKYHIVARDGTRNDKADPFGIYSEKPSASASRLWYIDDYEWDDKAWMDTRHKANSFKAPVSVYEMHIGSWRRKVEEDNRYLTYKELADELVPYLLEMNYTHVEFLPINEFPFKGSWGYQVVGYFAPTARFGTPQELMYLIDRLHQNNIGVIIDWVPSHFGIDMHGLINFDGTPLFEHSDVKRAYHPEWGSVVFDYSKEQVQAFLISSAMFWLDKYHIDGIRVDAVASMIYLNYARKEGQWQPNEDGSNDDKAAIAFIKKLNASIYARYEDVMMIAEESTAWPMVTAPTFSGGLGFELKWNMGWMHDTLKYFARDPIYREHHHRQITFSMWYAFDENFMLPLSHDEVVHMKGSLINKMPGDTNQKFAHLRALYAYMMAHPGKKLLFMGGEFAQYREWDFDSSLDWHLLKDPRHKGLAHMISQLNHLYRTQEALFKYDNKHAGFAWIDENDAGYNTLSFMRKSDNEQIYIACNFADHTRFGYEMRVESAGVYEEIFSSQDSAYEGWNIVNPTELVAQKRIDNGHEYWVVKFNLPAVGVVYIKQK